MQLLKAKRTLFIVSLILCSCSTPAFAESCETLLAKANVRYSATMDPSKKTFISWKGGPFVECNVTSNSYPWTIICDGRRFVFKSEFGEVYDNSGQAWGMSKYQDRVSKDCSSIGNNTFVETVTTTTDRIVNGVGTPLTQRTIETNIYRVVRPDF